MSISTTKREQAYAAHGGQCGYCVVRRATHLDHMVPRSRGGTDAYTNIVAACDLCGHVRGGRTIAEWVAYLAAHVAAGRRVIETPYGPWELPAPMLALLTPDHM